LGNCAEADIQWLISKLEYSDRVISKALPHIVDLDVMDEVKALLRDIRS